MPQTILVTGASGFIAAHVITEFLEAGFNVRGTVRSERSAANVRETHSKYANKLSFAIVPDVASPNAFDEAVKDVDGVIHTASPFVIGAKDYDTELFQPAIQGTTSILKAVQGHNSKVKRVVITSSFASVIDINKGLRPGYTYTEADWNPVTYEEALKVDGASAYCASKTFAEHAAFDYVEKNKPSFNISTVCPPMVYGPVSHYVASMSQLNTSSAEIYGLINGSEKEVPGTSFYAFCDVRDVARSHLLAYTTPEAAGQRYLIASTAYTFQIVCDIIRAKFPELRNSTPEGKKGEPLPPVYSLDHGKAVRELGMTFRSLEDCIVDTVESLQSLKTKLGGK